MANAEPTTRRINAEDRRQLIEAIRTKADETSRLYGKLVRWKQGKNAPWHYGIGLSNTYLFYPSQTFGVTDTYQYENIRIVNDSDSTTFSPIDVIERLIQALYAFEEKVYNDNSWNDEIFARLIVTNKAIDCKNETEAKQYKEAEKEFRSHLKIYAPELNPRIVSNKFPRSIVYLLFIVLGFFVGIFCSILLWSKAWDNLGEKITPLFSGSPNFEPIQVLILIVIIVIIFLLLARFFISISNVEWSGFRGQKLWDWLSLLIVPIMLAVGAFFLNFSSEQRQNALNDDQQKQESLKSYLSQVKDILIKDSLQAHSRNEEIYLYQIKNIFGEDYLKNKSKDKEINEIIEKDRNTTPILSFREQKTIEALTQTMLKELNESRKRQVIEFLAKSKLITYPDCKPDKEFKIDGETKPPQILIDKADLKDVDLSDLDLSCVNFDKADLGRTIFDNSDLSNADLTKAKINKDTSFKKANLITSNIKKTGSSDQLKNLPISLQKILTLKNVISNTNRLRQTNTLRKKDFNEINIPNLTFENLNI